jgi:signal peptidase I
MKEISGILPVVKSAGKANLIREIVEWAVVLGLAVGLAFGVRAWAGEIVTIDGPSMQPHLWAGERVLIGKVEYYFSKPKRGDIVLSKFPGADGDYIKRVIGLGGERIAIRGGSVYVDGEKLSEPYIAAPMNMDMEEVAVPDGCVFLMGDNRNDSHDSRYPDVGPIPLSQIEGRAYALVWPPGEWTKLTQYAGTLEQ